MKTLNTLYIVGLFASFSLVSLLNACAFGEDCVMCVPDITETVTKANLQFVPVANPSDTIVATLSDLSQVAVFKGIGSTATLQQNTQYQLLLDLWNEQKTIPEHISTKIAQQEAQYHQCFYFVPDGLALDLQYADADSLGQPVGLKMNAQTYNSSYDTLRIVMMLEIENKDNSITTGETEIDIKFPINIE